MQFEVPSAEFVESFVIFLYGCSNIWLEHLAAWGGAWTAQDFEHVSISVMFFGGGLVSTARNFVSGSHLTSLAVRYAHRVEDNSEMAEYIYRDVTSTAGFAPQRRSRNS